MDDSSAPLASIEEADLEWCHDVVEDVSRTFAISIDLLDEPMSSTLCVGYLVCRIADTIEDAAGLTAAEKDELLATYDRVLDPDDSATAEEFVRAVEGTTDAPATDDWQLVRNAERVVRTAERLPPGAREAVTPPARELVGGMRTFVTRYADEPGIRIQTADELTEYCHYVAGVIGHLVTNLQLWNGEVEIESERMRELSESFGQLLQLVNIAKDVYTDYADEANVYLPAEWLSAAGVAQDAVLEPENEAAVASVVERTTERAYGHADDAQAWIEALGGADESMVTACSVPFLLAVATLRELSERPADALSEGGVKIDRREVMAIVASVTTDFDQSELEELRERVRRGELVDL